MAFLYPLIFFHHFIPSSPLPMSLPTYIAIIDLGTNTFHLLLVEIKEGHPHRIHKESTFVKLAAEGIETIGSAAFARGIEALDHFSQIIAAYKEVSVFAFGTAALRTASNGREFMQMAADRCGIKIQLINGDKEAELISWGVKQAVSLSSEVVLIMDIGGGSVEFIFLNNHEIFWKQSYPLGAAVLKRKFHLADGVSAYENEELTTFLEIQLGTLLAMADFFQVKTLIGASGTFDTLVDLSLAAQDKYRDPLCLHYEIALDDFTVLKEKLCSLSFEERLALPGMPADRAEMINGAVLLIAFVIRYFPIERIIQSEYAIKEGILWGILNGKIN